MNKFNNYYKKILSEEINSKRPLRSGRQPMQLPPIPEEGIKELLNGEDSLYIRVYDNSEDLEDGIENDDKSDALNIEDSTDLKNDLEDWLKSELKLTGKYFIRLTRNRSDGDEVIVEYDPGMTTWDVSINR